jgi:acyl-coenzyme A synthetase/AMP-(fatty) acid ligase
VQSLSSTETGIISTFTMDKHTVLQNERVPSGHAVRGVEIFLVDEKNQPVQNGGEGKIAVRSARLRQGYWRQPELTAEKFLSDGRDPNVRIFISNDVGRFLPDGSLEYLGRADQLVKIRGQRVDLSEVEAALLATELVKEVVVTARADESGKAPGCLCRPTSGRGCIGAKFPTRTMHTIAGIHDPAGFCGAGKTAVDCGGQN